jgi:hypothetical protein
VPVGWREFTGRDATERSRDILREKFPHERGLSKQTMDAVHAGDLEIVPDELQSELLKDLNE